MTLQEKLDIIKAYNEGKPIEVRNKAENFGWSEKYCDVWNFEISEYRIKPDKLKEHIYEEIDKHCENCIGSRCQYCKEPDCTVALTIDLLRRENKLNEHI